MLVVPETEWILNVKVVVADDSITAISTYNFFISMTDRYVSASLFSMSWNRLC